MNAGWVQIKAKDADIGATINCDHIVAIRLQPEMSEQHNKPEATGRFMVFVDLITGQTHALTLDTYDEASREYERLSADLRGETVQ